MKIDDIENIFPKYAKIYCEKKNNFYKHDKSLIHIYMCITRIYYIYNTNMYMYCM